MAQTANQFDLNKVIITADGDIKDYGDATGTGGHRQYNISYIGLLDQLHDLELFDLFSNLTSKNVVFAKENTAYGTVIETMPVRQYLSNSDNKLYPTKGIQTAAVATYTTNINYSKTWEIEYSPESVHFDRLEGNSVSLSVTNFTKLDKQKGELFLMWGNAEMVSQLVAFFKANNKITDVTIKKDKKGDPVLSPEQARKWLWGTLYNKYQELKIKWNRSLFGIKEIILVVSPTLWANLTQALYNFTESTRKSYKDNINDIQNTKFANMKIIPYGRLGFKIPKGKPGEVPGAIDVDDEYDMTGLNAFLFPQYQAKLRVANIYSGYRVLPRGNFYGYAKWYFPRATKDAKTGFVNGKGINFEPYKDFMHAFNFKIVDPA